MARLFGRDVTDRWQIGRIELAKASRQLRLDGKLITLGARAFDVLMVLVEQHGRVVLKDELLASVWPGVVVEENNLTVQVSTLRKLLGKDILVTIPGRGYQLGPRPKPLADMGVSAPPGGDGSGALELPEKASIAVLPFASQSGGSEELFCDGITEDVITELARFRSLFVISRNTSFGYKGRNTTARQAGEDLGVRYILEGSVRQAGRRVRVSAHLVEAASGTQVWAEKYDRVLEDLFEVQEELTSAIVGAIAPQIEFVERSSRRPKPANFTAYQLALQAWATLRAVGTSAHAERRERARQLARESLVLDPSNALAIRTIAWAQFTEVWLHPSTANVRAAQEAVVLLDALISADRGNHDGYYHRGLLQFMLGRPEAGLQDLRRALELNPNDSAVMSYLGYYESMCGNAQAGLARTIAALRLSPRDPQRYLLLSQIGWCHCIVGDYETALQVGLQSAGDAPWFPGAWLCLAVSHAAMGQWAEACTAAGTVGRLAPDLLQRRLGGQWIGTDAAVHQRFTQLLRKAMTG